MDAVFDNLVRALAKLPGLGTRSAERAAMALVRKPAALAEPLREALDAARDGIHLCGLCGAITSAEHDPCRLCTDPVRDSSFLCVVEEPGDIAAIERSGSFNGRYHALMGKLSAARASSETDLRMNELMRRVSDGGIREVVLALSTDVEGDATASMLAERLSESGVKVTRLAFGLPAGSGVGYSDPLTIRRALSGRQSV